MVTVFRTQAVKTSCTRMDVIMSTAESGWLVSNEVKTVCIPHNITKVIGELYVDMVSPSTT